MSRACKLTIDCIDCHTCANYCIEEIEGSDWSVGACGKGHKELDPKTCVDFEEYVEEEASTE